MDANSDPTPLQSVSFPLLREKGISLFVKREDLRHSQISGNKWHKLKYNLQRAQERGYDCIASFGGPWSNHLHALAYAGQQYGLKTIGFVRGDLPQPLNAMLQDACDWGMELRPLSYSDYRRRYDPDFVDRITTRLENAFVVPEGGANDLAIRGCVELSMEICRQQPDMNVLCAACGTGATLAGLIAGVSDSGGNGVEVLGFAALSENRSMASDINGWSQGCGKRTKVSWRLIEEYHCGGFAKLNRPLVTFMDQWRYYSDIPLEPVYTGKLFYGLFEMIGAGHFPRGTTIVALHSGGLQGLRGMEQQMAQYRDNPGD